MELHIVKPEDDILRSVANVASESDIPTIKELSRKMFDIMYRFNGVGLAAVQLGIPVSFFVMNANGPNDRSSEKIVINPNIIYYAERMSFDYEGCLSLPGISAYINRPFKIVCKYTNLEGKENKYCFSGMTSRIFQHEYDHLMGIMIIDRMKKSDQDKYREPMKRCGIEILEHTHREIL